MGVVFDAYALSVVSVDRLLVALLDEKTLLLTNGLIFSAH